MYGTILRLDAARQNRIDPEGFLCLFSTEARDKIKKADTRLNSSYQGSSPFTPNMVRQALYPDYFRGTGLQTLYWKLKNFPDLHTMSRVFINKDNSVVFEFEDSITDEIQESLERLLRGFGHIEFQNPERSGKRIGFDVLVESYPY